MGRLIDWPTGVGIVARAPLTGPRATGGGSESLTGYVQTVSGAFGVWRWQFQFAPMRGEVFRRYAGTVAALHGGANALRVPFFDPDGHYELVREAWSDGSPWLEGGSWTGLCDWVAVGAAAAIGATQVQLAATTWGQALGIGSKFGFLPHHFGLYMVTEVMAPGVYRIWPPLRKAIVTTDYATLWPVMAMKMQDEGAASAGRALEVSDGAAMTLIEVTDDVVKDYFADAAL